jgi:hypothetical protein
MTLLVLVIRSTTEPSGLVCARCGECAAITSQVRGAGPSHKQTWRRQRDLTETSNCVLFMVSNTCVPQDASICIGCP